MNDDLVTFGKYFNKVYLHGLIERHTTATKSQNERNTGIETDLSNPVIITSKLESIASLRMLAYLRTPTDSQEELTLNRPQLLPC